MEPGVKLYTPEEYLALEEKAQTKNEYFQGRIYQMSGASFNHIRIVQNLSGLFYQKLEGKDCEAFGSDTRILVKSNGLYTYPDLAVVCGPVVRADTKMDTLTNPLVIIEVLSDSTDKYDRTAKFDLYKGLDSLRNYVLIDQHLPYIQVYNRLENEPRLWVLEPFSGLEGQVYLSALDISLDLSAIYRKVEWSETPSDHLHQPE